MPELDKRLAAVPTNPFEGLTPALAAQLNFVPVSFTAGVSAEGYSSSGDPIHGAIVAERLGMKTHAVTVQMAPEALMQQMLTRYSSGVDAPQSKGGGEVNLDAALSEAVTQYSRDQSAQNRGRGGRVPVRPGG